MRAGADEFVGIVRPGTGMLERMITGLWFDLHPEACRTALVKGSLDVVPSVGCDGLPPHATDFDGEALWRTDKAMRELKSRQGLLCLDFGGPEEGTSLAQSLGESLYVQLLGWTRKQLRALDCYARLGSQVRAAEEMGVHQSTVSRSLSSIRAGTFLRGLREFQEGVDWLDSGKNRQGE